LGALHEYLQQCKSVIPIVVLYIVSCHTTDVQVGADEDEHSDDDTRRIKITNDLFWKSLIDDDDDVWDDGGDQLVAGTSTHVDEGVGDRYQILYT
jgi:hypothetical protein